MASLQDALTNVRCLQDFSLPDEQPTIEPEPTSIVYEVSFDTNFADRTAFITGSGRYNEEATICSGLVRLSISQSKHTRNQDSVIHQHLRIVCI